MLIVTRHLCSVEVSIPHDLQEPFDPQTVAHLCSQQLQAHMYHHLSHLLSLLQSFLDLEDGVRRAPLNATVETQRRSGGGVGSRGGQGRIRRRLVPSYRGIHEAALLLSPLPEQTRRTRDRKKYRRSLSSLNGS